MADKSMENHEFYTNRVDIYIATVKKDGKN